MAIGFLALALLCAVVGAADPGQKVGLKKLANPPSLARAKLLDYYVSTDKVSQALSLETSKTVPYQVCNHFLLHSQPTSTLWMSA